MIRRRMCLGCGLAAFGLGLLMATFLQSGFCTVILGLLFLVSGCVCMR